MAAPHENAQTTRPQPHSGGLGGILGAAPSRPRIVLLLWALTTFLLAVGWWLSDGPVDGYMTHGGTAPSGSVPCSHDCSIATDGVWIYLDGPESLPVTWLAGDHLTAFIKTVRSGSGTHSYDHVVFLRVERAGHVAYTSRDGTPVGNLEGDLQSQHRLAWIPISSGVVLLVVTIALVLGAPRRRGLLAAELGAAIAASAAVVLLIPIVGGPFSFWALLVAALLWVIGLVLGALALARSDPGGDGRGYRRDLVLASTLLPLAAVIGLVNLVVTL